MCCFKSSTVRSPLWKVTHAAARQFKATCSMRHALILASPSVTELFAQMCSGNVCSYCSAMSCAVCAGAGSQGGTRRSLSTPRLPHSWQRCARCTRWSSSADMAQPLSAGVLLSCRLLWHSLVSACIPVAGLNITNSNQVLSGA